MIDWNERAAGPLRPHSFLMNERAMVGERARREREENKFLIYLIGVNGGVSEPGSTNLSGCCFAEWWMKQTTKRIGGAARQLRSNCGAATNNSSTINPQFFSIKTKKFVLLKNWWNWCSWLSGCRPNSPKQFHQTSFLLALKEKWKVWLELPWRCYEIKKVLEQ